MIWSFVHAGEENVISKKSKVTFGGRLHAQFHTSNVDAADDMNNTFYVRRARLAATFKNSAGTLEGKVQYDLGDGGAKLKDGYVNFKLDPRFNVKVGQYKKPFSLWELTSTTKTMVIERGNKIIGSSWKSSNQIITKDGFYAGRDIGAMVHGKHEKVKYYVGVFNGNGDNKKSDSDNGKLFGGRVVVNAAEDLYVGGSVSDRIVSTYTHEFVVDSVLHVDTTENANFAAFEGDVEYGIRNDVSKTGPWIQAEFVFGSNPHISDEAKFMALVFVGSYNKKLTEGGKVYSVRPAVRFDFAQRDTDDDDTRNILLTPGVDIFFDKYNRLQINIDINLPQEDGADTEIGARVQAQIHL
jgi:hypothetical protein